MSAGKSGALSAKGLLFDALSALSLTLSVSGSAVAGNGDIVYSANPPRKLMMAASSKAPLAFPSPSQCVAQLGLACYTPALMRAAYNIPAGYDGTGQTIVIVDAYGSPTVQDDLNTFSAAFGLPTA